MRPAALLAALLATAALAAQDGATAGISTEELARVMDLTRGTYQMEQKGAAPPAVDDLALATRIAANADPWLAIHGLRALLTLFRTDVVERADAAALRRAGTTSIDAALGEEAHLAVAAGMLLRTIADLDRAREAAGEPPVISTSELRRLVIGSADRLRDGSPTARSSAAGCMATFAPALSGPLRALVVRGLLDGLASLDADHDDADRDRPAVVESRFLGALAAVPAPDAELAAEATSALLARLEELEIDPFGHFSRIHALAGLGRHLGALAGEPRERVFATLLRHAALPENAYMATSGRLSPPLHAGLDALALAIPAVDAAERQRAVAARDRLRELAAHPEQLEGDLPVAFLLPDGVDTASMFAAIDTALRSSDR